MSDLIVGIGLVLVFEGLLWALAPGLAVRMLVMASQSGPRNLRNSGIVSVVLGFAIVWAIRG